MSNRGSSMQTVARSNPGQYVVQTATVDASEILKKRHKNVAFWVGMISALIAIGVSLGIYGGSQSSIRKSGCTLDKEKVTDEDLQSCCGESSTDRIMRIGVISLLSGFALGGLAYLYQEFSGTQKAAAAYTRQTSALSEAQAAQGVAGTIGGQVKNAPGFKSYFPREGGDPRRRRFSSR
jgi:hypothetical protein